MAEQTWINLNALRAISRNNESFVREVLAVFRDNTPKDLDQLASNIQGNAAEQVRYYAHKLKSSCFTIGFERGYEIFKEMEDASENNRPDEWPGLMEQASTSCEKALEEINTFLGS